MQQTLDNLLDFIPLLTTAIMVLVTLYALHWLLLKRPVLDREQKLPRQLFMLVMNLIGLILIVLALPVSDSLRNQVLALVGVLVSGVLAFSSTSITSNFMAWMMLRSTRPFRVGDFIRVENLFGRVTEIGLLDSEIQTEHRELISIPNSFLINHPVSVIRYSGAVISADVSLGYDVHHMQIESLLIKAAERCELEEPFVQIIELGNYAIAYRVSGLLKDIKNILTVKSNLHRNILDTLHNNGVEIVSPTFMNQRSLQKDARFIPSAFVKPAPTRHYKAEDVVFDKAEEAAQRENAKLALREKISELEAQIKASKNDEKKHLHENLASLREQLQELEKSEPEETDKES